MELKGERKHDSLSGKKGSFYDLEIATRCGYCRACRLRKRRDWIVRNYFENIHNPVSYVFTLTYKENPTFLNYKDLQKFHKRMRNKNNGFTFRHFSVGEYGTRTLRPHYHVSYYGLSELSDLTIFEYKNNGYHVFRSKIIEKIWKHGMVFIQKADGDSNRIAYTTLYHTKNQQLNAKKIFGKAKYREEWQSQQDFQKFLNSVREKNLFSSSVGFDNFYYTYYDKYKSNGGQFYIDGYAYHIPLSWLKKLIEQYYDEWAFNHYNEIKDNQPCIDLTIEENILKGLQYYGSNQEFDDLQKMDNKVF
jgi:hypothetical protein